ncbi:heme exporter protein CcmD [Thermomonas sp.]|uniref:heme exporter protein CcmD n=1 Tax=Thermomonas sp. TaxID=1971895 RepID=UPI0026304204|nr:heme exporter protein CcmD [Thermomonas sp.]
MSYRDYVIAAYAVFAVMLAWDYLVPKLLARSALRAIRNRQRRALSAQNPPSDAPLSRG